MVQTLGKGHNKCHLRHPWASNALHDYWASKLDEEKVHRAQRKHHQVDGIAQIDDRIHMPWPNTFALELLPKQGLWL